MSPDADFSTLDLAPQHVDVLTTRGISPSVARSRGVFTARQKRKLEALGFSTKQQLVPSLVIPMYNTLGERVNYAIRPDEPRIVNGKPAKYEPIAGTSLTIDVPPDIRGELHSASGKLVMTEGPLKADAAVGQGLACIDTFGIWNFARRPAVLADWDNIVLVGRDVFLAYDSDMLTKEPVHLGVSHLREFLKHRHASVWIIYLPAGKEGAKVGLDDYLLWHSPQELFELADRELRPLAVQEAGEPSYRQTPRGIFYRKQTRDGIVEVPITNFTAEIVRDVVVDQGADEDEIHHEYEIAATIKGRTARVRVDARQFASMNWTGDLGHDAIISPGMGARDHARAAIQYLSMSAERCRIFAHTGWTTATGRPRYLTASGGIGADGLNSTVEVRLSGPLCRFALPDPPVGDELVAAVRASLRVLDVAPDTVTAPMMGAVHRAPLGSSGVSVHLFGETGSGKTELGAVGQQHYGPGLDSDHVPASWSSTGNFLEGTLHALKDVVALVDDLVFEGSPTDVARIMRTAAQVFRGQGNHAGRGRMRPDRSLASPLAPRGVVLSTGEERPPGASLAARRIDVEVLKSDVDWAILTECQKAGREGLLAEAMAGYVQWLSPRIEVIQDGLREEVAKLRGELVVEDEHRRTPTIIAELLLGWCYFLQFCVESMVLTAEERDATWRRVRAAMITLSAKQTWLIAQTDPTTRVLDVLRSAIATAEAHVLARDGGVPADPGQRGWREHTVGTGDFERTEWRAGGKMVGWVDGEDLYLDSNAAYRVAQSMVGPSGEPLHITLLTFKKRLDERGMLATVDETQGRRRLEVRVTLGGRRVTALHLRTGSLLSEKVRQVRHAPQRRKRLARRGQHLAHKDGAQDIAEPEKCATFVRHQMPDSGVEAPHAADAGRRGALGAQTLTTDKADGDGSIGEQAYPVDTVQPCSQCGRAFVVTTAGMDTCSLCPRDGGGS